MIFLSLLKRRLMTFFFILLFVSGCGQAQSSQKLQQTSVPIHCKNITPTSTYESASLGKSIAFDLGGCIHIQSTSGFTCSFFSGFRIPGTLILPKVLPTYDQGTLQILKNYLAAIGQATDNHPLDTIDYPTFHTDNNAFKMLAINITAQTCIEYLHIWNTGKYFMQIMPPTLQLTADTQKNNLHYNLIDGCSSSLNPWKTQQCPPAQGGGESTYYAKFDLHSGKKNTTISTTCWIKSGYGCLSKGLVLQPGEVAEVELEYDASDNLSFSLRPTFTLGFSGEQQRSYPVPQLQQMFAFTFSSQFSCYALQSQHFIEVPLSSMHWCI